MAAVSTNESASGISLDAALKEGPNTLLASKDVARILSLKSTNTLAQWRCGRKGPDFIRLGANRVAYRAADVLAYVESKRVQADARVAA